MLSTHIDPFSAFVKDLQMYGCEVHLYNGPNQFGCLIEPGKDLGGGDLWDKSNLYFLSGVRPGLTKRAADSDVLWRGMFTLDFDIRKELEKIFAEVGMVQILDNAERILASLEHHPLYGKFRYAVLSGNGLHLHYFGEPVEVNKEQWVAGMKNVFAEVAKLTPIPPDYGCGNAGRIMRMPGSWNVKDPANKKPVDFLVWMPRNSLPSLSFVQERGAIDIDRYNLAKEAEKQNFIDNGAQESDLIELVNAVPVEQVIAQLFAGMRVKQVKKDGGMRFADEKGEERGFFRHHQYNIIVHEGTSLFPPPKGKGYNPLGLVKAVLQLDTHNAIKWFCERSSRIREQQEVEKREWLERENTQHIFIAEEQFSHKP